MEDKQLPRSCIQMYIDDETNKFHCDYYNNGLCSRDWEEPCVKVVEDKK
jgi:hypothetical protein